MLTIALLTALGGQEDFEQLWQETRAHCMDKPFVSVSLKAGGKGSIQDTTALLSNDGKFVVYSRSEEPAWWHGGTGRFPMIVTENKVTHFDGKELTVFDALTGKTEKTLATDPSPWQFRGLRLFWLDKREEGEWKIKKVEETDFGGESPTRVRHFTLSSPKLENDLVITVRSKDGFVIDEYEVPSKPLPPDQLGGGAGQKTYYEGKFLDAEPAELKWKAPNRKEGR